MQDADTRPSKKQRELLNFIDGFITGHGYGPSYREVMRSLNYKSVSTVAVHVNGLIQKGQLAKRDNSARSLYIPDRATPEIHATKEVTSSHEKWLVDDINKRLAAFETSKAEKEYDELCILVSSLGVLGMTDAYRAMKDRLKAAKSGK